MSRRCAQCGSTWKFADQLHKSDVLGKVVCASCWSRAADGDLKASTNGNGDGHSNGAGSDRLRTRRVDWARVRPSRWLWARRIPIGTLSLIVGEEGVGKGTLAAWIIARATCGDLEGELEGVPVRVLVIGDEDGFEPFWVPRLYAAGADLHMVDTLADDDDLSDIRTQSGRLAAAVREDDYGFLVFDQLLDNLDGGRDGAGVYNPKAVRQSLQPLRRAVAELNVAALGLLHPNKGKVDSFRELMQCSHQFNAVSRSSMLLGKDPEDDKRRVLVRGKGNHSAAPRSVEFLIAPEVVELNGYTFEAPRVVDIEEGDRTASDLLTVDHSAPVRDELAGRVEDVLTDGEQTRADIARAVGREPKDRTVGRVLEDLALSGVAEKGPGGGWRVAESQRGGRVAPPKGGAPPVHTPPATVNGNGVRPRSGINDDPDGEW